MKVEDVATVPDAIAPLCVSKSLDPRPYLDIRICGHDFSCLLDSGATSTIVGAQGIQYFEKNNLTFVLNPISSFVTTADGTNQSIKGQISLPITFQGVTKTVNCLVVPTIVQDIILGVNFGAAFGICFDFTRNTFCSNNEIEINTINVITPKESLSPDQVSQLDSVVSKFLSLSKDNLFGKHDVEHFIDTGDARPFKQRQYLFSPVIQQQLHIEVDEMLANDIIEKSNSPWSSPILMVKKKDGSYRPCFDGRKLNELTVKDSYPLPRIDNILNHLRDSQFLSSLDLSKAFWQIPLEESSKAKTAFQVHGKGLFQFKVMPFGLCNAPQTLQRLMDSLLGPELERYVFVYLDDVIVATPTFELHIQILEEVHDRLRKAGLRVNFDKCDFARRSLSFLGFIVDTEGLRTDRKKVESILETGIPKTTTEVRRIIGVMQWYRRFIKDFSTISAPITALLKEKKKGQSITWTPEADTAFRLLKERLVTAPVLASPDFSRPFIIQTDASDVGLGAVLLQTFDDGDKPIAFTSRTLTRQERNYSVTEKECLAVLFGVEKFRGYVEGSEFTVETDHSSLLWLYKLKDPIGRLARWCLRLSQFSFKIIHRKGSQNVVADFLSRNISYINSTQLEPDEWYKKMLNSVSENPTKFPDFKIENGVLFKHFSANHDLESNLYNWKMVLPTANRKQVLFECHDHPTAGHLGVSKTHQKIFERYYWPGMRKDIRYYVLTCTVCGANKHPNQNKPGLCGQYKNVSFPFQCISLDFVGPFPKSRKGNTQLLVVTDWFTKFVLVQPMAKATTMGVIKFLENQVFLLFGVPQIIMADNGSQFTSKPFRNFLDQYKVKNVWYNARYHPQVNFTERVNKVIGTALASYIKNNDHRSWDIEIFKVAQAIRTSQHEVTGYSPAFLMFGRNIPLDGEFYGALPHSPDDVVEISNKLQRQNDIQNLPPIYDEVRKKLKKAYEINARHYNLRRRPLKFKVGDKVYRTNFVLSDASKYVSKKLAPKYIPCVVTKVLGTGNVYELSDFNNKTLGNFHIKDLKPYHERSEIEPDDDGSEHSE